MRPSLSTQGLSIVEILVASAILATLVTAIGGGWQLYLKVVREGTYYTTASNLSEEGAEAIQLMRDISWSSRISPLTYNTEYDLYWDGDYYIATTSHHIIQDAYRRTITFSSIQRDAWDNITSSGGVADPRTRQATINIYFVDASSTRLLQTSHMLVHDTYAN